MAAQLVNLNDARAAKTQAQHVFQDVKGVCGFGITKQGTNYAVQVNVDHQPDNPATFPSTIDGVPIVYRVTGTIHKQ